MFFKNYLCFQISENELERAQRYSGTFVPPAPYISTGSSVLLNFQSDFLTTNKGFQLNYQSKLGLKCANQIFVFVFGDKIIVVVLTKQLNSQLKDRFTSFTAIKSISIKERFYFSTFEGVLKQAKRTNIFRFRFGNFFEISVYQNLIIYQKIYHNCFDLITHFWLSSTFVFKQKAYYL